MIVGDTVKMNVSFYANDGTEPGISWFKVMNDSQSEVRISRDQRHHISTFDEYVLVSYYNTYIMERGKTTQLSIFNVKAEDLTVYKVKINNTIGTTDYTVTLVPNGKFRRKGNDKRKRCAAQKLNTSLNDLSTKLREHGRHVMLSFLSSLPIPVLCILAIEANRFYNRNHQMYEAALLT